MKDEGAPESPPVAQAGDGAAPNVAIVAVAKNEGIYLHEWVAYHRLLGFGPVLVYDNDSSDGSSALLAELQDFGLVTRVPWHVDEDVSPQATAYADGLARLGPDFGWVAFIDLDEFFVLPGHSSIGEFLRGRPLTDALAVNWKNFGSSGHDRYEPAPVIDRFRRCSVPGYGRNRRVKVLAHTSVLRRPGVHSPKLEVGARFVDVAGGLVTNGRSSRPRLDEIRLNHYYTKSVEEWVWKVTRGRGGKPASLDDRKHWYPDLANRDVNDDEERDITQRLPALLELMARTRPSTAPELPPASRAVPGVQRDTTSGRTPVAPIGDAEAASLASEAAPALNELGWSASRRARRSIDAAGHPLPEFTYAATAFLASRDTSELRVLTYGSPDAAMWWAARARSVVALRVAGDRRGVTLPSRLTAVDVAADASADVYVHALATAEMPLDVVTLDGAHRVACAGAAVGALSSGGVIVLNNSERSKYRPIRDALTLAGFRSLELAGMGPRLARLWGTSVFYRDGNVLGI